MCTMSVIGDDFMRRHPQTAIPSQFAWPQQVLNGPTRAEFDALKQEMQELRLLLLAAKRFDEATGQADCEQEEKIALIRQFAKLVGVDFSDVFPPNGATA